MKWILKLTLTYWLLSASGYAQLSSDEYRQVLKALIDRDAAVAKVKELTDALSGQDEAVRLLSERIQAERNLRFIEKKLYLDALLSLREYRLKRRALIVKIVTLGIVRDKRDERLEEQIKAVQTEITAWK